MIDCEGDLPQALRALLQPLFLRPLCVRASCSLENTALAAQRHNAGIWQCMVLEAQDAVSSLRHCWPTFGCQTCEYDARDKQIVRTDVTHMNVTVFKQRTLS